MKVLIACEFSGLVRSAFCSLGHEAYSCDLLPAEDKGPHLQQDVLSCLDYGWDLLIGFPPCTHLCGSGARWFNKKQKDGRQQKGIAFFMALANAPIKKISLENPVGIMSKLYRKPDQIIQPWQFGHGETKATCLWLKNLPLLVPTNHHKYLLQPESVGGREGRVWKEPPSEDRWKNRSRTYIGIANAMAAQWSL